MSPDSPSPPQAEEAPPAPLPVEPDASPPISETEAAPPAPARNLSCDTLASRDEYALYFNQLCGVFTKLMQCYHAESADNYEAQSIRIYLSKILYSIQALRKKYIYNPAHSLRVDLTASGFPNFLEMCYLDVDLKQRQSRLIDLPPANMLKQSILDYMFANKEEPKELLWQLSEREYCEMLDDTKLFLSFTPGAVSYRSEGQNVRNYVFSWGCYDFKTNRPYLHLLSLDQDLSADPLHWKGPNYHQFLEVIKAEGSRVPDVGVLALAIDNDLDTIHPKVLKRICIGPLHSNRTCSNQDQLCGMLARYSRAEEDFILLLKDEIVFSHRQAELAATASAKKRVREIFYIPEADLECYEAKASMIHRYMLLPHGVLQHMERNDELREYDKYRKLSFDQEGHVHGI